MTAPPRHAAFAFVFVVVLLDMMAFGLIIPVLPKLVESFMGGDTVKAAHIYGIFGTSWALMQFLFSPVLGALSDRFGRRPVILLSCFGLGFDFIMMALAPDIWWLFLGRVISGITAASVSTASAYIADITPMEGRAKKFGLLGAAFGLGFVLGPAIGGLLGGYDPRLPFWVAAGLSLLNGLWGLFVLPESLPVEKRASFSWRRANPVASLRLLRSHPELFGLATVMFMMAMAFFALPSTFVLYSGYRFQWSAAMVGAMLALVGLCAMVIQGGLVGPVVKRFGERRTLLTGLCFGVAGFAIYGLAPSGFWLWFGVPVMALRDLGGPALNALMTRHVGPSEQGALQGANSSLMGIAGMIGPIVFTQVFASFIGANAALHLPGAPFLLASCFMATGFAIAWRATK